MRLCTRSGTNPRWDLDIEDEDPLLALRESIATSFEFGRKIPGSIIRRNICRFSCSCASSESGLASAFASRLAVASASISAVGGLLAMVVWFNAVAQGPQK